jgi:hypothetical protein
MTYEQDINLIGAELPLHARSNGKAATTICVCPIKHIPRQRYRLNGGIGIAVHDNNTVSGVRKWSQGFQTQRQNGLIATAWHHDSESDGAEIRPIPPDENTVRWRFACSDLRN